MTSQLGTTSNDVFTFNLSDTSIDGLAGNDTVLFKQTKADATSATLISIEILKAGLSLATTFTVDQADLVSNGSVVGSTGSDTLTILGSSFDLSSTSLTSIERLVGGSTGTSATTFLLDQADLMSKGSIVGTANDDVILSNGTSLDLTSTTLTSVEILQAGTSLATTFTVDSLDLVSGGSVIGSTGTDILEVKSASIDLTSTTLTSIEVLQAGLSSATTFKVDTADLASGGSVIGSTGNDTLAVNDTDINLTSTALTSVEILKAGSSLATTFTLDKADLASGGSVIGSSGSDVLIVADTHFNLTSTTLTSVEVLAAGSSLATTFTVDKVDLANGGSVFGSTGSDTLIMKNAAFDLTSTTLTGVERLQAGLSTATVFTVDANDLASGGSVIGSTGNDTLTIKNSSFNLASTTLTSVEILRAGVAAATTFTVVQADLANGGSVIGSTGSDTLTTLATSLDLSGTTLASVEILKAGSTSSTTFLVDQADLKSGGSVTGSTSAADTVSAAGSSLDLTSTTLTGVEVIHAGTTNNTTFTVSAQQAIDLDFKGSTGHDTLAIKSTAFDLTSTTLTSIEILKAGLNAATTFTVDQGDLASGGSVIGSSGSDTLSIKGTSFDLSSTALTSVEKLQAGSTAATTFTLDQDDLASKGSVIGSTSAGDTILAGASLDLTSTTLTGIENLKAATTSDTTMTVNLAQLNGLTISGSTGNDTLIVDNATFDLTSTTLNSIENLQAGLTTATTFKVDLADLAAGGSVTGNKGSDTLIVTGTDFNLTSTSLTSVERLQAQTTASTTFTLDKADLASSGSVVGSTGSDVLIVMDTDIDLTSTTLTSVETLQAGTSVATTFTVDKIDLVNGGSVVGSTGNDTLIMKNAAFDLTSTALTSIEVLQAGVSLATTFTVDKADLVSGGSVVGSSGNDTLSIKSAAFDLSSTTLGSVEILKAGVAAATTFTVNQLDLAGGGSVIGSTGNDTLTTPGTSLDLSSTTLTSVEILKAGSTSSTTFLVDQADLKSGGSVTGSTSGADTVSAAGSALDLTSTTLTEIEVVHAGTTNNTTFTVTAQQSIDESFKGNTGNDTLAIKSTAFDLTSTTLTSIEILKAGLNAATTFTVDQLDLASGGSVIGSTGSDTLSIKGTSFDLSSTALTSVEKLQAGSTSGTTFKLDQNDLAAKGSVIGSTSAGDTILAGTTLDLTSTTLTGIENLKAGSSLATTMTVNLAQLNGLTISGSTGNDTLIVDNATFDLTSTTLNSIENLQAGLTTATTFKVDLADLAAGGSVTGNKGSDTLIVTGTAFNLTSTTLTSVEKLQAGSSLATTFTLDTADLAAVGSVIGSSGNDTLVVKETDFDLTSTTLTSVEILQAGSSLATTFTVDKIDLVNGGSVVGSTGNDTLIMKNATFDLTSTALTSIEVLKAGLSTATTFTVDKADLASGGSVFGSTGTDTLTIDGTSLDLTSTTLSSIEILKAGSNLATTFAVDQADLKSGGSVIGSAGNDTLTTLATSLDLSSTTLTSIEILKAGSTSATTFLVDQADLKSGGSVIGSTSAGDTVSAAGSSLDLTSTTLSQIEVVHAGTTANTTFTVTAQQAIDLDFKGSTGNDTLAIKSTAFDLTSTALTSIEILKAGLNAATTFTVDQGDLASGGSVIGSSGSDTLSIKGTSFDLSSTALTSVEKLQAGSTSGTTFKLDQNDLASKGSVIGSTSGGDTILAGTTLDLTSTTLTGIENLKAATASDTTMTVNLAQLNGLTISGSTGSDTLIVDNATFDLTSTTLNSIENLQAGLASATTFKVDLADLAAGGSVTGNKGIDTLIVTGTDFNLTSTSLTSVERLQAQTLNTTFTLDSDDLNTGGSVIGSTGALDTIVAAGTQLDLTSTTVTGIEVLAAGTSLATTFTVDQADLKFMSVQGSTGDDKLVIKGNSFDLSSSVLTSIEILKGGSSLATTFRLDQADLATGGSVIGSSGNDTLIINGTSLDLTSTTLTSVEILRAGTALATTFVVNQADLAAGGTVQGGSGRDNLLTMDTELDLTSTTLSSIEILRAGGTAATTFTVDQTDLANGGSVFGVAGKDDALVAAGSSLNLSGTVLTSIEMLQAGSSRPTTFIVDQGDLASGGSVQGSTGIDTLTIFGSSLDLTSTTLTSIEVLKAGTAAATTFLVDQADLIAGGTVQGSIRLDTLAINGTQMDLGSTSLLSVEILMAGLSSGTTFLVDQGDLLSGGSVVGHTGGADTLTSIGTSLDLTSTTLTSVEILAAAASTGTDFTVDQTDLLSGGSVLGHTSGTDALVIHGTSLDLTDTTLTSIEILRAGSSLATTFTVEADDLASGGTVQGSTGNDTLAIDGTSLDLTSTTLSSIEILKAGLSDATTFTVDQADLATITSILGSSSSDTLIVNSNAINLTSTTLTSIETIETATQSIATTFTVSNGEGGSTIELSANAVSDTIAFSSAYKVGDITSDTTILAHTISVASFLDGSVNGDVIDVSGVSNGTPTASHDISNYIDLLQPATLKAALNIAAAADGSATSEVVSFQYGGDTYILVDKSASASLTANDAVIKLVGTHTLVDASNLTF